MDKQHLSHPVVSLRSSSEAGSLPSLASNDSDLSDSDWEPPLGAQFQAEVLENGDSFSGYVLDGLRHGRGVYHFANGSEYEGDWWQGVMQGWGMMTDTDTGEQFKGHWSAGERSFGILVTSSGAVYQGGFRQNRKHGRGVLWEHRLMYEVVYHLDVCVEKHLWSIVLGDIARSPQEGSLEEDHRTSALVGGTTTVDELQRQNATLSQRVALLERHLEALGLLGSPSGQQAAVVEDKVDVSPQPPAVDPVAPVLMPTGPGSPDTPPGASSELPSAQVSSNPAHSQRRPAAAAGRTQRSPNPTKHERLFTLRRDSRLLAPTAASVAKVTTRLASGSGEAVPARPSCHASPSKSIDRPLQLSSSLLRPCSPKTAQSPALRDECGAYDLTIAQMQDAFRFYNSNSSHPS